MKVNMKIMMKMIIKVMVKVLAIQFLNNNKLIKNLFCKIRNNKTKFNTNNANYNFLSRDHVQSLSLFDA